MPPVPRTPAEKSANRSAIGIIGCSRSGQPYSGVIKRGCRGPAAGTGRSQKGVFHSVNDLIAAIQDYLKANNDNPKPFIWTATAEQILAKVARGRVTLQQVKNQ